MKDNICEVIIEIPLRSNVKYELDHDTNRIIVDRILQTSMMYPANYGFIDNTLAADGDPLDALVLTNISLIPGCSIKSKPVGIIYMEDEKGKDEKILCVPADKIDMTYAAINDINDIPQHTIEEIKHFLQHYKDLEKGKFVKVTAVGGTQEACDCIKKYQR
jgi:inorganic pyrophosphatase